MGRKDLCVGYDVISQPLIYNKDIENLNEIINVRLLESKIN